MVGSFGVGNGQLIRLPLDAVLKQNGLASTITTFIVDGETPYDVCGIG